MLDAVFAAYLEEECNESPKLTAAIKAFNDYLIRLVNAGRITADEARAIHDNLAACTHHTLQDGFYAGVKLIYQLGQEAEEFWP